MTEFVISFDVESLSSMPTISAHLCCLESSRSTAVSTDNSKNQLTEKWANAHLGRKNNRFGVKEKEKVMMKKDGVIIKFIMHGIAEEKKSVNSEKKKTCLSQPQKSTSLSTQ